MSAAWLGYTLLLGAMLSAAAWAADAALRGTSRASRWVWVLAMVALFAGSLLAGRPRALASRDSAIYAKAVSTVAGVRSAPTPMDRVRALRDAASVSASAAMVRVASRLPEGTGRWLLLAWLLASGSALAAGAGVHWRITRRRRQWPVATVRGERVRVAPDAGPAVIGIVRAEIVLPSWLLTRSEEEQAVVVAHEREHQRSGDHLLLSAACVSVALMPWHPAAWWMLARLRLALELDCDARVIARGLEARRYGGTLIDLAARCDGFRLGATALADHTTHLERRLRAMSSSRKVARSRVMLAAAVAALAVVVACEARVPTSAEVQAMDVRGAEQATGMKTAAPDMVNAQYYIDGLRSTAEQAHALPADRITSMRVEHVGTPDAPDVIRIATTGADRVTDGASSPDGSLREWHMKLDKTHFAAKISNERVRGTHVDALPTKIDATRFAGLVFIDGIQTSPAALKGLDPTRVASIDVIKGVEAARQYSDPAAKNGVLRITTKK